LADKDRTLLVKGCRSKFTQSHLAPRSKKDQSSILLYFWAFMARSRVNFTFKFTTIALITDLVKRISCLLTWGQTRLLHPKISIQCHSLPYPAAIHPLNLLLFPKLKLKL